jgi:hypothetical protein
MRRCGHHSFPVWRRVPLACEGVAIEGETVRGTRKGRLRTASAVVRLMSASSRPRYEGELVRADARADGGRGTDGTSAV